MNRRTALTIACGGLLVAAGFVGGWLWRGTSPPGFATPDQLAIFLEANISDGMTVDQIKHVFGFNQSLVEPSYPISKVSNPILKLYRSRPAGFKDTDSFASFTIGDQLVLFQLREGRVINWGGTDIFIESAI